MAPIAIKMRLAASGTRSSNVSKPGGDLLYTLDNPSAFGTSAGDFFGFSVSISDSFAIVGARNEDDSGGSGSGKAHIFTEAG